MWVSISLVALVVAIVYNRNLSNEKEKAELGSGAMFDSIAGRYDMINKVISLGMDMGWRRELLEALDLKPGHRLLDLATGTADVAILAGEELMKAGDGLPKDSVVGIDPSSKMLDLGRQKVSSRGLDGGVSLLVGDAQKLEGIAPASFDRVTMSFGIRNVPDRAAALREIRRVVKKDGIVAILELHAPFATVTRAFVRYVPPLIGYLTGSAEEYGHLQRSMFNFPEPGAWQQLMEECGLHVTRAGPLWGGFGSVWLYVAQPVRN